MLWFRVYDSMFWFRVYDSMFGDGKAQTPYIPCRLVYPYRPTTLATVIITVTKGP